MGKDQWKFLNRCVVCGTKLVFKHNERKVNAKPEEGTKTCEQNHARFTVYGSYDRNGRWLMTFVLPCKVEDHAIDSCRCEEILV